VAEKERPVVVYAALAANIGIAIAKFVVAGLSGSSALLSEAIHSVADSGNEIFLLIGLKRAARPADRRHPFGHGKELYFWGLVVAMTLFAVGGGMSIFEGVTHLIHPKPLTDAKYTYVVLAIAFVLELGSFVVAMKHLLEARRGRPILQAWRESKDPSLFTVVAEDAVALIGVLVAFAGIALSQALRMPILDGVASLVIGFLLVVVALMLVSENRGLLVGEAARQPLVDDVEHIVERDPAVRCVGGIFTMHLGPNDILVDVDLELRDDLSGNELRHAIHRITQAIRSAYPKITRVYFGSATFAPREA
jgi:cation diffusion facilitator family transporter